jgi:hypothetical protein
MSPCHLKKKKKKEKGKINKGVFLSDVKPLYYLFLIYIKKDCLH